MQVAVRTDRLAERSGVREQGEGLPHLLAAAADRIERLDVLRELDEDAADLLVDGRRQERERLGARVLRAKVRVGRVGAERCVHRAGHAAEPTEAREETL